MKHNLLRPVVNYRNEPFTQDRPNPDGTQLAIKVPVTLRDMLEQACIMANPQKYTTADKKLEAYKLLEKLAAAEPFADLQAEDVVLLKALLGESPMTITAVGAILEMLDNPLTRVLSEAQCGDTTLKQDA